MFYYCQSATEERFNCLSHTIGALAAVVGLYLLLVSETDPWKILSFSIFGGSMIALYTISSLYHGLHGRAKNLLRKLDYLAIYVVIAGTYAPFTLVTLRDSWGWPVFAIVWGLAAIGIILDLLPTKRMSRALPIIIYLTMGWMALFLAEPLLEKLPQSGFTWLVGGGVFYTLGLTFYCFDCRFRYFHTLWHLFVLVGSFFHYMTIYLYIA